MIDIHYHLASVDPTVWKGKNIISSWLTKENGTTDQLQLVTFKQQSANQTAKGNDSQSSTHNHARHTGDSDAAQTAGSPGFPYFPAAIGAVIVLLAVWLFAKRKRKMV
ncbi:LPXTG cell wall anchor domain-containing protein [Paenibacillus periandrae]|uniref:LPXTG cell wall anchor domain-containing protein n=1 Tax=Paenibacillus periandrae TaxID=1761741 RepID=UPI001F08E647|nr:LPXTG cell wall anchor domain-containing protein [Paenibacillus periandrae]